jgi:heterotetrameric sarcosine oxidase gamma subunit
VSARGTARPVRRSAIESRHAAIGARWIGDATRWPSDYGAARVADPAAGAATSAATTGARLAEIGPFEEWLLRGPGVLDAVAAMAGTDPAAIRPGRVVAIASATAAEAWVLGPDEVLLLGPAESAGSATSAPNAPLAGSAEVSIIEMTGARTTVRLVGPSAPAVLSELCPADTRPTTLTPDDLIQAPLASVRAFITRRDTAGEPGYTIMIARDEAAYAWDSIAHVGAGHGLAIVGPAAVAGEPR